MLELLLKYNHKVAILTKGGKRSLNDLELLKKFGNRIKVGQTLTFENSEHSKVWEEGGAFPDERIEALKILHENGIKTWSSFEPVIIPDQSLNLLSKVASIVDTVKIGKINNYNGINKIINWADFIKNSVEICRQNNLPFYIKNDLAAFNKGTPLKESERNQDFLNL